MFCPECGAQNPEGSKFCSTCAMQLPLGRPGSDAPAQGPQGTMVMPPSQGAAPPSPYPPQEQKYDYPYNPPPPGFSPSPYQQQPIYAGAGEKASGRAIASMVLAIGSIFP